MPIASFATKVFEVSSNKVYTFDDLQFGSALESEKQDNPGTKPKTYIKGPDLSSLSFKITVNTNLGLDPRNEVGDWLKLKNDGKPYPFIVGGRPFGANQWLLKDVQVSDTKIDNVGNFTAATIALSFEEYVFAGSAKEAASSKGKKSTASANTTSVYNALSPAQKKELK